MKKQPSQLSQAVIRYAQEPILLAFSGGMDSVLLAESLRAMKIPFTAAHFNHRWRGAESEADARWVERWCKRRNIPCVIGQSPKTGKTSENFARNQRLAFLQKTAEDRGISQIWMAHHADDLVETFLLQLMRGAGAEGLASLKPVKPMGKVTIVRPWLDFFKEDLLAEARKLKLRWREDRTNQTRDFTRNRVRLELIPAMKRLAGRDVRKQIRRTVLLLAEENAFWQSKLPKRWPARATVNSLKKMPLPLQRRWVRGWLQARGVRDISFDDVEAVCGLIANVKPAKVNLSRDVFCRRTGGYLWLEQRKQKG